MKAITEPVSKRFIACVSFSFGYLVGVVFKWFCSRSVREEEEAAFFFLKFEAFHVSHIAVVGCRDWKGDQDRTCEQLRLRRASTLLVGVLVVLLKETNKGHGKLFSHIFYFRSCLLMHFISRFVMSSSGVSLGQV